MKIHEYQGKEILGKYGVQVPQGKACFTVAEAKQAAEELGGGLWVVKAQIHAGGRGKGGGVKVCKSVEEVEQAADAILGMQLVTHQTGPEGQTVRRLLVEKGAGIAKELYLGLVIDRKAQQIVIMASAEGGMEIEEVAAKTPDKIKKSWVSPKDGVDLDNLHAMAAAIGLDTGVHQEFAKLVRGLHEAFVKCDASLLEINPLVVLEDGHLMALDAKFNFDENALFRQPDIVGMKDEDEEDPAEREAAKHDLSYIALDGNIGCMVNGAGLAMATMDIIKLCGGEPANFLDVGGGATADKITAAFKLMLANPELKAILVNIFGGIMRCDVIAEGIVTAARDVDIKIPLVIRLEGTNVEKGKKILDDSGLEIIAAQGMQDAANKVVAAAG